MRAVLGGISAGQSACVVQLVHLCMWGRCLMHAMRWVKRNGLEAASGQATASGELNAPCASVIGPANGSSLESETSTRNLSHE